MTDVVSVIGDLERVLQATTTANLSFATGYPALCANCATSSASGVVNPGAAASAGVTAAAVMKSMREADAKAAMSAGSGRSLSRMNSVCHMLSTDVFVPVIPFYLTVAMFLHLCPPPCNQ